MNKLIQKVKILSVLSFLVLGTVNCGPGFKVGAIDGKISQIVGSNNSDSTKQLFNFAVVVRDGATGSYLSGAKVLAGMDLETTDGSGFANFGLWPAGQQPFDVSLTGYDTRTFPCNITQDTVCTVNIFRTAAKTPGATPKPTPKPAPPAPPPAAPAPTPATPAPIAQIVPAKVAAFTYKNVSQRISFAERDSNSQTYGTDLRNLFVDAQSFARTDLCPGLAPGERVDVYVEAYLVGGGVIARESAVLFCP